MTSRSSIKRKLMTAIMATSVIVLLATCGAFIAYEVVTFRKGLVRDLTTRAGIIAANSTAALAFRNEEDAEDVLSALGGDPGLVAACLYDRDGRVFARYPADAPDTVFPTPEDDGYRFGPGEFVVFRPVAQGDRRLGTVFLRSDLSAIRERYSVFTTLVLVVFAGSILLAFGLSMRLQKGISEPILNLTNAARGASERRDYSLRTPKVTDDEIGVLTDSFNDMLDQIRLRESSLRENEARMRAILESSLDGIVTMNEDGSIVEFNPAAETMFGRDRNTAVGSGFAELIVPEPSVNGGGDRFDQLVSGGASLLGKRLELDAVRAGGDRFPVELAITRISRDGPATFAGFMRDITERRKAEQRIRQLNAELERRVEERTAELESTNRELEAFSYSVSHDLRAPLRAIDGFSRALAEDGAGRLDEKCNSHITRVLAATRRMGILIDELLNLSRLSKAALRRRSIDLTEMARQTAQELHHTEPERRVEFVIAEGLSCEGDLNLVRAVIDNLLGNAWKYTSRHDEARIEVGGKIIDGARVFYVRDDGAGFDMEHAGLLFSPFQRLHRQSDFEGTGIGLATVQRIVHRHGGRIWAEGTVEGGATFYFTLNEGAKDG